MRYYCDIWEYVVSCRSHIKLHIKNKHEVLTYHCDNCKYSGNVDSNYLQ